MIRALVLAFTLLGLASPAALAQTKPELTIYTYDGFNAEWGPGPGLKAGFEKRCDCTINFVAADSSIGALRRIQLEGATTKADILLGIDTSLAGEADATGLFAPHGVDTAALVLPNNWSSPDFVPFDYGYFAFVYNKKKLPNPPTSFADLIARKGLKILIEDPRSDTPGLGLMLWVKSVFGDKAKDIWPALAKHVVTMTPDWSTAYSLFLKGEADMVLSYTTSPAYHLVTEKNPDYAAAPFTDGHYTQIEIAGILKSSPNKALASQFLAWLITPEAQTLIPHTNWMYPVAKLPKTPEGFDTLYVPEKPLLFPDKDVAAHSKDWIEEELAAFR